MCVPRVRQHYYVDVRPMREFQMCMYYRTAVVQKDSFPDPRSQKIPFRYCFPEASVYGFVYCGSFRLFTIGFERVGQTFFVVVERHALRCCRIVAVRCFRCSCDSCGFSRRHAVCSTLRRPISIGVHPVVTLAHAYFCVFIILYWLAA